LVALSRPQVNKPIPVTGLILGFALPVLPLFPLFASVEAAGEVVAAVGLLVAVVAAVVGI
jgi:VIT1/CCC1 family predicted Fe2+/Mn2+ transporter